MKIKIKQTFRSMWALVLAVLMLLSTFSAVAVTLNVESTGAITGNIYFDNTKTQYSSVYVFLGHNSYLKSYKMSLDSDNIWKTDESFSNNWNDATAIYFASTDGGVSGGSGSYNMSTSKSSLGLSQYTNNSRTVSAGTSSCYVPETSAVNTNLSIMNVDEAKASHSGSSGDTSSYTFKSGRTIYFDFTGYSDGYNYINADGTTNNPNWWSGSSICSVTLTSNLKVTTSTKLFKTKTDGENDWSWKSVSSLPTEGQDMIVCSDGKNATWGTYDSSSATNWYINGNFTGEWKSKEFKNGTTISLDLNSGSTYEFKLFKRVDSNETWYGNNDPISVSVTDKVFTTGGGNCQITPSITGTYTFTIDTSDNNPKLSVTYPQAVTSYDVTLDSNITGGSISSTPSTLTGLSGTNRIDLTANANQGYEFAGWSASTNDTNIISFDDVSSATTKATVKGACTITATFTQLSAATNLAVTATPSSCKVGETIKLGYTGTVVEGATVAYEYSADDGSNWSTASESFVPSSAGTYKFRVTASKSGYQTVTSTNAPSVSVTLPDVARGVTLTPSPATVEKGNAITLTASLTGANATRGVKYSFLQTTSLGGSFSPESVTGIDANEVTFTPTAAGTYKFTVTASCAGYKQKQSSEITVTVTAPVDVKGNAFSEGMWIDAQPDVANSADAMVKAYFGKDGFVKFYLPGSVNLTKVHFYHKYNSLKVEGVNDPIISGNTYDISSWNGKTITYGGTSRTLQIFQSTAKSFFTTTFTTAEDGSKTPKDMPTTTKSSVTDATTAADYKKQCSFSGTYRAIDTSGNAIANNTIKLKGRGNSSWEMSARVFGKYAYNITLGDAVNLAPASAPDSGASKKWSMLANNVDEAMMRNMLVYNLSDAIGLPDSPMSDVYNVYNNGTYLGSYQMSEKVEVGDNLLVPGKNVDKLNEGENTNGGVVADGYKKYGRAYQNGTNINDTSTAGFYKYCTGFTQPEDYKTGNYLLEFELNERFNAETSGFISNYGQQVVLKSPEVATQNEVEYAMDRFNFAEAVIYALAEKKGNGAYSLPEGSSSPTATLTISNGTYKYTGKLGEYTASGITDVIDVENFAKAYLIQEFTENLDGVATSFYVDITGEKDVLVSKPVWDFDWTMGQYNGTKKIDGTEYNPSVTNQWFIRYKNIYPDTGTKNIIAKLCSIESFWNTVKTVWNGTSSASLLSTGSSSLFPVSALMGKKASINPVGSGTAGVYDTIKGLYGDGGLITGAYKNTLSSSVAMNEDRYNFISDPQYSQWNSKNTGATWEEAVNYLDTWANKRATWMNARLNDVPEEKNYLYFKDEGNYNTDGSTIHAHIYNYSNKESAADWPGIAMVLIDPENKIYRVEYTDNNYTNVIFSKNGNSKIGNENDLITQFSTNNMLVYSGTGEGQWHWETYQEAGTYKVNQANTTNGSFTVSPSTANEGDTITIKATPASGFVVDNVTVTGASGTVAVSGSGNTRTFTMPASDVTVSVTFKAGTASDYVVYLDNAAGWATPYAYAWNSDSDKNHAWPGEAMTHVTGNIYKLTFTEEFANIIFSNNGANQTGTLTFGKVNNGKIYNNKDGKWSVYDTDKSITVSAGTCTGGSVTIDGKTSVDNLKIGDQITLTATASTGNAFTGWKTVAGLSITDPNSAQTSASITSVDANIVVTANFSGSQSDYYIKGTFNNWEATDQSQLYTTSGDLCTTTIALEAGTYEFQVWKDTGDNGTWYGNKGTIVDTTTATSSVG